MSPTHQQAVTTLMQRQQRAVIALHSRVRSGNAMRKSLDEMLERHRVEMTNLVLGIKNARTS